MVKANSRNIERSHSFNNILRNSMSDLSSQKIKDQTMDEEAEATVDPRLVQANKLYQTGVMLIYGKRKSVEKAIKCVQRAIVLEDSDYRYWQLLGEAYYQRGSLNPAINCFMKSLDRARELLEKCTVVTSESEQQRVRITADCIFSKLRMSDIRLSVSHLNEAMSGYVDIIDNDPNNVAALVGLSKTELQMARNNFSNGLVKSGHDHCMRALKYALKTTSLCPHLCYTWKLASDCCLIQILYGQRGNFQTTIEMSDYPGVTDAGLVIDRLTCIELAQQFLCKALSIEDYKSSSCLWHNLGISLYLKATIFSCDILKENQRKSLLHRSMKCLIKALDNDRASSQVRNSIGLVAFNLNLMNTSQNLLIKSIQSNMSTSEIQFSNLGYIYLQKGEFRPAGVAFKRSQAEEPLYCRSWLGNALINEQSNVDNMTYLRHCHKLENNYDAQLMYATRVTSLPNTVEYVKDLTNALDCMQRVINYNYQSLECQNTLGLLYERGNMAEKARCCFEEAHTIAPGDSRVIFNRLRQHNAMKSSGCVLSKDSSTLEIDAKLVKAAEKLADGGNREYMLNFIYYLFKNCDFRTINPRITKVIEKLPQDDVRSKISAQILLAMSDKKEGGDFKSWLFKNIIDSQELICVESLVSLLCLMLFGATGDDKELVTQVASDLMKYLISYLTTQSAQFMILFYSIEGYWTRLLLFTSIFVRQTDSSKLIRPMVALFPTVPELWLYLGLSMMFGKTKHSTAAYCIQRACMIGSTNPDLVMVCHILLAILSTNQSPRQTKLQQHSATSERVVHLSRAIFKSPNQKLLWDSLENARNGSTQKDRTLEDEYLFQLALDCTIQKVIVK